MLWRFGPYSLRHSGPHQSWIKTRYHRISRRVKCCREIGSLLSSWIPFIFFQGPIRAKSGISSFLRTEKSAMQCKCIEGLKIWAIEYSSHDMTALKDRANFSSLFEATSASCELSGSSSAGESIHPMSSILWSRSSVRCGRDSKVPSAS